MALSSRVADNDIMVVKSIDLAEAKTKNFAAVAKALGLTKALVVTPGDDMLKDNGVALAARNIPGITVVTPDKVNVYEVLNHKQVVLLEGSLSHLEARLK